MFALDNDLLHNPTGVIIVTVISSSLLGHKIVANPIDTAQNGKEWFGLGHLFNVNQFHITCRLFTLSDFRRFFVHFRIGIAIGNGWFAVSRVARLVALCFCLPSRSSLVVSGCAPITT